MLILLWCIRKYFTASPCYSSYYAIFSEAKIMKSFFNQDTRRGVNLISNNVYFLLRPHKVSKDVHKLLTGKAESKHGGHRGMNMKRYY